MSSPKKPPPPASSPASFQMLTDAPMSEDWNKENLPLPPSPNQPPVKNSSDILAKPLKLIGDGNSSLAPKLARQKSVDPSLLKSSSSTSNASSPSNLLKRPLAPADDASYESVIKRRKETPSFKRSTSFDHVKDDKMRSGLLGAGASPNFPMANPSSPSSGFALGSRLEQRAELQQQRLKADNGATPPSRRAAFPSLTTSVSMPTLQRSLSENFAASVMRSCEQSDRSVDTGDMSRSCALPLIKGNLKHPDLHTIDCHTLAKIIRGEMADKVASYRIFDARYEYEYSGGHIRGAENYGKWDEQAFFKAILPEQPVKEMPKPKSEETQEAKRDILIFHCEFSSVRGPALMKELRKR